MASNSMSFDNFPDASLKIQRADKHIEDFYRASRVLKRDTYWLHWQDGCSMMPFNPMMNFCRARTDADFPIRELIYTPLKEFHKELALIIGDSVHNLNAALDYSVTSIARRLGEDGPRFVTFPSHEYRENLVPGQVTAIRQVQRAIPNGDVTKFFQNTIEPCADGNEALWSLRKLDKIDKHNFLIPNIVIGDIPFTNVAPGITFHKCTINRKADKKFSAYCGPCEAGRQVDKNIDIPIAVLFPPDGFFGNEAVFPTLINLRKIAVQTLKAFDAFVTANG